MNFKPVYLAGQRYAPSRLALINSFLLDEERGSYRWENPPSSPTPPNHREFRAFLLPASMTSASDENDRPSGMNGVKPYRKNTQLVTAGRCRTRREDGIFVVVATTRVITIRDCTRPTHHTSLAILAGTCGRKARFSYWSQTPCSRQKKGHS